jgi:hypothetical protein
LRHKQPKKGVIDATEASDCNGKYEGDMPEMFDLESDARKTSEVEQICSRSTSEMSGSISLKRQASKYTDSSSVASPD